MHTASVTHQHDLNGLVEYRTARFSSVSVAGYIKVRYSVSSRSTSQTELRRDWPSHSQCGLHRHHCFIQIRHMCGAREILTVPTLTGHND